MTLLSGKDQNHKIFMMVKIVLNYLISCVIIYIGGEKIPSNQPTGRILWNICAMILDLLVGLVVDGVLSAETAGRFGFRA